MLLWVFGFRSTWLRPAAETDRPLRDHRRSDRRRHSLLKEEHAPAGVEPSAPLMTASALVLLAVITDILGLLLRDRYLRRHRCSMLARRVGDIVEGRATRSGSSPLQWASCSSDFRTRLQDRAWGPSVDGSADVWEALWRDGLHRIIAACLVPRVCRVSVDLLAREPTTSRTAARGASQSSAAGRSS